jgi:hypothetical protein
MWEAGSAGIEMAYLITDADRQSFKRCRRQWDFGARVRRNLEAVPPLRRLDFDRAMHEAFAVYYFPGMWDWDKNIVLPLVLQAFHRSARNQQEGIADKDPISPEEQDRWNEGILVGERLLSRYFEWAPAVDLFAPVRVETDFEVNVPIARHPTFDLMTADGDPVRYGGRVDALVIDENNAFWILQHRLVERLREPDELILEERASAQAWAMEIFYLMPIAGTIYNELRLDAPAWNGADGKRIRMGEPAVTQHRSYPPRDPNVRHVPEQRVVCHGDDFFRRTWIARGEHELHILKRQFAAEAAEMIRPDLSIFPTASPENCSGCQFRTPCIATNEGARPDLLSVDLYRERPDERRTGRLGASTWGIGRGAPTGPLRFD